jgi:xylulokinase
LLGFRVINSYFSTNILQLIMLLGVDFGTGGCKITLINNSGNIIAASSAEYPTAHPILSYSEQDPADWFPALIGCFKKIKQSGEHRSNKIHAVAIDASTHNAVLLEAGCLFRPATMWTDQRSRDESVP